MNLSLAFLHGEQALVGFMFAAVIVLLGFPLVLYFWVWHSRVSERKLAVAFFIVTAGACGVFAFSGPAPASILVFTVFFIGFIFSLPWNVITILALRLAGNVNTGDQEFALLMLLGAGINAMLLYFAAKKMRGLTR